MHETTSPLEWLRKSGAQGDVIDGLARFTDWQTLWRDLGVFAACLTQIGERP